MKLPRITRRGFLTKSGIAIGAAALATGLPEPVFRRLGKPGLWLPTAYASPGCTLNPQDPPGSGFEKIGGGQVIPGQALRTVDNSSVDNAGLFCADPDIGNGDVEVEATFRVNSFTAPAGGVDVGVWCAIGDGQKRVILACAEINGQQGVGLPARDEIYTENSFRDPANTNVLRFVPVPSLLNVNTVTFRRRASDGAGLLVAVNGTTVNVPSIARPEQPTADRAGNVVELGSLGRSAQSDAEFTAFASKSVGRAALAISQVQIKPSGAEKVQVQGTFTLPAGGSIDPATERVLLSVFRSDGVRAYPTPSFAYTGIVGGFSPTSNGWALNQLGRDQSHAQSFGIERTADPLAFTFSLVDTQSSVDQASYDQITVLLEIGDDSAIAGVAMRQQSSGNWVFP